MATATILQVAAALVLFQHVTDAFLPNGECSATDMVCRLDNDNVIGIITDTASAEECEQNCKDSTAGCKVYSYFGKTGVPFVETCILFSECSVLDSCEDCFTKEVECGIFCNAPVEGAIGENLIDFVSEVSEAACEAECTIREECNYFTYHWDNSTTFPATCFLLEELLEPITHCEDGTCISGSPGCVRTGQNLCAFLDNGILYPNGIVVTETDFPGKAIDQIIIGECPAAIAVAVGGGGTSDYDAGSGSGYVEFIELEAPTNPYMQFQLIVGKHDEASELVSNDGNSLLIALPGVGAPKTGGGSDGYSGGGADPKHDGDGFGGAGGTDGGDGQDSPDYEGGQGSGLDISTIPLKNFQLR